MKIENNYVTCLIYKINYYKTYVLHIVFKQLHKNLIS